MAGPSTLSANLNANSIVNEVRDGWDNDCDWGSLEEEPINEELEEKASNNHDGNHASASRSNSNSQSHSSSGIVCNNNTVNNISPIKNNGDGDINSSANSNWDNYGTAWNDDEFEPIEETGTGMLLFIYYVIVCLIKLNAN